jgi:hypothetical protein
VIGEFCNLELRRRNARLRIAFLILLFSSTMSFSQTTPCTEQSVVVDVRDRFGHFVSGLQPGSFDASSHGQALRVLSASLPREPRRVVLLLDVSGSIAGPEGPWTQARFIADRVAASPAEI